MCPPVDQKQVSESEHGELQLNTHSHPYTDRHKEGKHEGWRKKQKNKHKLTIWTFYIEFNSNGGNESQYLSGR